MPVNPAINSDSNTGKTGLKTKVNRSKSTSVDAVEESPNFPMESPSVKKLFLFTVQAQLISKKRYCKEAFSKITLKNKAIVFTELLS